MAPDRAGSPRSWAFRSRRRGRRRFRFASTAVRATTAIRSSALKGPPAVRLPLRVRDRKSTRLNSSHANISYAVFCSKKKNVPARLHVLFSVPLTVHSDKGTRRRVTTHMYVHDKLLETQR